VAADDDVLHAERQYGVFDGGGNATVHLPVGRHHITYVAGDEQGAGVALGDQLGDDARIGAGDEHRAGRLRRGQTLEQRLLLRVDLLAETAKALQQLLQGGLGVVLGDGAQGLARSGSG